MSFPAGTKAFPPQYPQARKAEQEMEDFKEQVRRQKEVDAKLWEEAEMLWKWQAEKQAHATTQALQAGDVRELTLQNHGLELQVRQMQSVIAASDAAAAHARKEVELLKAENEALTRDLRKEAARAIALEDELHLKDLKTREEPEQQDLRYDSLCPSRVGANLFCPAPNRFGAHALGQPYPKFYEKLGNRQNSRQINRIPKQ